MVINSQNTDPRYSIIIPAYNDAEKLARCLDSLNKSELMEESEIIVVDDCSPDNSTAINCAAKKYNAAYFLQPVNAGPGIARNRGAEEAKGDILVFIDSDCVAPVGWLSKITGPIQKGKCSATISCYCGPVFPNWISYFQDEDYRYRMPRIECNVSFLNSCNFAIKRKAFKDCGGFPEQRISEDMVLGLILAENGTPARFLPDACVLHDYYDNLSSYLNQRFGFAYNIVKSYIERKNIRSDKAHSGVRSFNPTRTAFSMFFTSIAIISFIIAWTSIMFTPDLLTTFMFISFISLLLQTSVNGKFLFYLHTHQGQARTVSYIFLLYIIDLAYIWGVIRGLIRTIV